MFAYRLAWKFIFYMHSVCMCMQVCMCVCELMIRPGHRTKIWSELIIISYVSKFSLSMHRSMYIRTYFRKCNWWSICRVWCRSISGVEARMVSGGVGGGGRGLGENPPN